MKNSGSAVSSDRSSAFSEIGGQAVRGTPREFIDQLRCSTQPGETWPDGDWPRTGDFKPSELEVAVGAVLTQNTRWLNVARALTRLRDSGITSVEALRSCADESLVEAIAPSGSYRRKCRTLRLLADYLGPIFQSEKEISRKDLLKIPGIGPETADSILLYAFDQLEFVVDAYTRRILMRLGLIDGTESYESIKSWFEKSLPRQPAVYKEAHALIVQHAKDVCRRKPLCQHCVFSRRCPTAIGR